MSTQKQPLKKNIDQLKHTLWLSGKIVKITMNEDGSQMWRIYSGLSYHYMITVPADVFRGRVASVEDSVRVFATPGRSRAHPYIAADFEVRAS